MSRARRNCFVSEAQESGDEKSADDSKPKTTTAFGEITVRATIVITFEMKDPEPRR